MNIAIPLILTVINVILAWVVWYRLGKQSVISDILKAYEEGCKDNGEMRVLIALLKNKIANSRGGKEAHDE